jgi:hypothetical protein
MHAMQTIDAPNMIEAMAELTARDLGGEGDAQGHPAGRRDVVGQQESWMCLAALLMIFPACPPTDRPGQDWSAPRRPRCNASRPPRPEPYQATAEKANISLASFTGQTMYQYDNKNSGD